MDYITIETLRKMREAGFTYPDYERLLNYGMLYHYNGDEYFIGGFSAGGFCDRNYLYWAWEWEGEMYIRKDIAEALRTQK